MYIYVNICIIYSIGTSFRVFEVTPRPSLTRDPGKKNTCQLVWSAKVVKIIGWNEKIPQGTGQKAGFVPQIFCDRIGKECYECPDDF